jgi:hypothetical protein
MYDPKKDPAFTDNPYLIDYQYLPDPCDNPNPPPWCEGVGGLCNNPDHGPYCDGNHSVPIEPGFVMVMLSLGFGVILLKGRWGI